MECCQPVDNKSRSIVKACRQTNQPIIDAMIGLVQELKDLSSVGKRRIPL